MSSGWTCSHQDDERCVLLKKRCEPGMKGCTLYGKALFAQRPSEGTKEQADRHDEKSSDEVLAEAREQARFF